jgi:predicted lipid-binding transport protein (Tim44 family)
MNPAAWQATTQAALNLGLINEHAPNTPEPSAPWPLRLMMGLGGWLVAVPMLGLIGLLIGETFHGYGGLGWGLFAICLSLVVLSMALGLLPNNCWSQR